MRIHARLDPEGEAIRLTSPATPPERLSRLLRTADPPIRARRRHGEVVVSFADAARLDTIPAEVDFDASTQRALENRATVNVRADEVLAECRRLLGAGPDEARRMIGDSRVGSILDDHQALNVAIMAVPRGWGTCVFDEQGTGKTVTVIAAYDVLVERDEADVLIVVAPKSMISEWANEFQRFTGGLYRVAVIDGTPDERARGISSGADVVVVNYESTKTLAQLLRLLARRSRAILVIDESFFIKNPDASRTRAVRQLREWCERCFVLCGTPAPNSPRDLIAQFNLVDFGRAFRGADIDESDRGLAAQQVRRVLDDRAFYVRNLKRDVLPHLPSRSFTEVKVSLTPQQQAAYEAALNDLVIDLRSASDREFARNLTSYLERKTTLLRICSDPSPLVPGYDEVPAKFAALDELLDGLIKGAGEKVVLWSFYRASLERISERYAPYGVARVDGSVADASTRRDAIRRFQEDEETMLFVGNPAAAGAGLTLHRARIAVYESLSNQAAHFLQSLDRIHRRGQERDTEYVTLLADGTIEEAEYERLLEKADRQADLLQDATGPRLTRTMLLNELLSIDPHRDRV